MLLLQKISLSKKKLNKYIEILFFNNLHLVSYILGFPSKISHHINLEKENFYSLIISLRCLVGKKSCPVNGNVIFPGSSPI